MKPHAPPLLSSQLRDAATLLRMMADGECRLERRLVREVAAKLRDSARQAERIEAQERGA